MFALISRFIHRPILTISFSLLILLLGISGMMRLPLRLLPEMTMASIEIRTQYLGANAQDVQAFVTNPLQQALVGTKGVDTITAVSAEGLSTINVNLQTNAEPNVALTNVMEQVQSVSYALPKTALTPSVRLQDKNHNAVMFVSVESKQWPRVKVADYIKRVIKPQLENVSGVSEVEVWADDYAMQIWVNPYKLMSYRLTPLDIVNALNSQNAIAMPGSTQGKVLDYHLQATTSLNNADQFNNIVIKNINTYPIRIRDIGEAKLGTGDMTWAIYANGAPTTMFAIYPSPTANPLFLSDKLLKQLKQLQKNVPADLKISVAYNTSDFIRSAVHEVIKTLLVAGLIVIGVMFLFLGSWRAVVIPVVTIPLSLIGMCFVMSLLGYSLNIITLLAMVLAIGLVVDDAIVVVENIVRHLHEGKNPLQATLAGTKELVAPIISMTITLAAVFAPIGFSSGLTGQMFTEFAFTLAGSVIVSGIIALSLSPMMAARLLEQKSMTTALEQWSDKQLTRLRAYYQRGLQVVFCHQRIVITIWALSFVGIMYAYKTIPAELMPSDDMGFLFTMGEAPVNANRNYVDHYVPAVAKIYQNNPQIHHTIIVVQGSQLQSFIVTDLDSPHHIPSQNLVPELQAKLAKIPGINIQVVAPDLLDGTAGGLSIVLKSAVDYRSLYSFAKQLEAEARKSGKFIFINDDLKFNQPEATIVINPDAAASAHVAMDAVSQSLSLLMSQGEQQQFSQNGKRYSVMIKTLPQFQLNPDELQNIPIPTQNGETIPLSTIASVRYGVAPVALNQFQKQNSVTVSAALAPGVSLSQGLKTLEDIVATQLPDVEMDYSGASRQFMQEGHRMLWIFALAIFVIFLVLSMLYESFRTALIILLGSIPLTLMAALLPLKLGLGTMNIYTQIGLLTLVGLISKHGILITEFANHRLHSSAGGTAEAAVIEAALLRFRPIIMTTLAMVVGSLPLIFATGAGSGSRQALGIVIGLGMSFGTVLTLFVLPVIYKVMTDFSWGAVRKSTNP